MTTMRRIILICFLVGPCVLTVFPQKHYLVEKNYDFDKLCFTLTANYGTWHIKPSRSEHPVNIFGEAPAYEVTPEFHSRLVNGTQHIQCALQENNPAGFGQRLSARVFSSHGSDENNDWHVYLTRTKPLFLKLDYGIGNAYVDLSGLSVKNLIIDTGSADVNVGYNSRPNAIAMDTFYVKVDMGNVHLNQLDRARAKEIITDVGFGKLRLDFSDHPNRQSHVTASVGAGTLVVHLPERKSPVLVRINSSPLCRVKLPENFREIKDHIFANESYSGSSPDLLSFDLDVAMGKISIVSE